MKFNSLKIFKAIFVSLLLSSLTMCKIEEQVKSGNIALSEGWEVISLANVQATGEMLSDTAFNTENWYQTSVPATVLAVLIDNGVYKDPYFDMNLEKIDREQFKKSWWYRKEFTIDTTLYGFARLRFDGINYSANIWLNGKKIASADTLKGSFRVFEIPVSEFIRQGENVLAVEVFAPVKGDFTIGFVDWTPRPNDDNMGIFRPVNLLLSQSVAIKDIYVQSQLNSPAYDEANLNIDATIVNLSEKAVSTTIHGEVAGVEFEKTVVLQAFENKKVTFLAKEFKQLKISNPKLWWPVGLGDPEMYKLSLSAKVENSISDKHILHFGIREVTDYLTKEGYRGYKVNGKIVQIRGGGWMDELLLREDEKNLEAQVLYTKQMGLNTIRLEGFWGSSHKLYDLCDKNGLLIMAGWSCQWEWEDYCGKPADDYGSIKTVEDMDLVAKMWNDQIVMFRNHPSIFVWVYGSDMLPRPELEKRYISVLNNIDTTRPILTSCKNKTSEISGPSGAKMEGPYDYVCPLYWYEDSTKGGAYGFNTETGPGPQVPPMESLLKMIPSDKLWPLNETWNYHCGRNSFGNLDKYVFALNERYGAPSNVEEFVKKAQLMNYEAIRPMFEAFVVNRNKATGVVQWMLNAAWPKMYWQLYDYYLMPNSAYFGTQQALKPMNIIYNYGNNGVYVTNDYQQPISKALVEIKVFDINSKLLLNKELAVSVDEYVSNKVFELPEISSLGQLVFVDLSLKTNEGKELAHNFYWLSGKKDVIDYEKGTWVYTPNKQYADFTSLQNMPKVSITTKQSVSGDKEYIEVKVKIKNESNQLAFFIEAIATDVTTGKAILPVFWNDNYISVLPSGERTIIAKIRAGNVKAKDIKVNLNGWNLK